MRLLSGELLHSSEDAVFGRVCECNVIFVSIHGQFATMMYKPTIRMLLAGDLEHRRKGLGVVLEQGTDLLCDVLVDEQDCDIGAVSHVLESGLDGAGLCFCRRM